MNLLFGSYSQPIAMLHKNVTPPLPNTEYVQTMLFTLKSNIRAVINSKNEFYNYFTNSLSKERKNAPKELEKLYDQLDTFGTSFVRCLEEFIALIEPTLKTTSNLNDKRSELAKALDEYQRRIVIVRKEMTEANIKAEGQKLQVFAKSLSEFNKESNDYKDYLLKLYLSACFQLEQGTAAALDILNKAIESPEELTKTQEEKELEEYIHQLNEQIAVKNEKEQKAKEEAAAKAQKEKEEKEKAAKQKAEAAAKAQKEKEDKAIAKKQKAEEAKAEKEEKRKSKEEEKDKEEDKGKEEEKESEENTEDKKEVKDEQENNIKNQQNEDENEKTTENQEPSDKEETKEEEEKETDN